MSPGDQTHRDDLLSDDIYRRLKEYILCDVIRPPERLQIGQLSRHFGVSITPVREALIRLAAENIIDSNPGRGFSYKEFIPGEQIKLHELLFCLLKYAVESCGHEPFQLSQDLASSKVDNGRAERGIAELVAAAITREKFYEQLAAPLGNHQLTELIGNLCERTRISRILWFEHCRDNSPAAEEPDDWIRLFQAGKNHDALAKLQKRFQAKAHAMNALAQTRQQRIYEAYPMLRPGSAR